ncbi:MAG TPA: hypothetical protein VFW19_12790 [Allosphingosinicella sp.]|nr:hypothetical protein [Allosphingosinicella sp.]
MAGLLNFRKKQRDNNDLWSGLRFKLIAGRSRSLSEKSQLAVASGICAD